MALKKNIHSSQLYIQGHGGIFTCDVENVRQNLLIVIIIFGVKFNYVTPLVVCYVEQIKSEHSDNLMISSKIIVELAKLIRKSFNVCIPLLQVRIWK